MPVGENSKSSTNSKRVISNLLRAALLVMPRGSAFEKAIFGPLDDQARDKARREIHDALDELKVDVDFTRADLKDQLAMLGENISEFRDVVEYDE